MNRRRYSTIAHAGIRFWNPLDEAALTALLRELPLRADAVVLDYGCGEGEVLAELQQHHRIAVTGIDINEEAIERCRRKLAGEFRAEAFAADRFEPRTFDLVVNIGASPGFRMLLQQVVPLLRPDGRVLIGDGYWQRQPSASYLSFLGAEETDMLSHEDNLSALHDAGLRVERVLVSDGSAWDRYEDRYDANMRAFLKEHPQDADAPAFEARRRAWRDMYLAEGRATMGFALYQAVRTDPEGVDATC